MAGKATRKPTTLAEATTIERVICAMREMVSKSGTLMGHGISIEFRPHEISVMQKAPPKKTTMPRGYDVIEFRESE